MTITLNIEAGEQAFFKIQFKNSDFENVLDLLDGVTMENVFNQKLFTVI
tara:strand:- start:1490 stop:1636 length:147 start_codon:yes stop_codon:yes gene_type:complete